MTVPYRWFVMKGHTVLYDTRVLLETTSGNEILGELFQGRCGKKKLTFSEGRPRFVVRL